MKINKEFARKIYAIRQKQLKRRSKEKNLIAWVEDHRLRSGKGKALVFILPTKGCSWALSKSGGCSICGYLYDNPQNVDFESMISKFKETVKSKITSDSIYSVKLFTSGSILDKREMPDEVLQKMLEILNKYDQIKEIVLESRPEYVTPKKLDFISQTISPEKIEIAIGLESANDEILRNSINKGFYWANFEKATKNVLDKGMKVKAYLIFKPPFVSEYDSILDTLNSAEKCIKLGVDTISINAVAIHRGTYLNELFEKKHYRTPWLWSLVYICKEIKMKFPFLLPG